MKKIILVIFWLIGVIYCYSLELTQIQWENPLLKNTNTGIIYEPYKIYEPKKGKNTVKEIYLGTQYMNTGTYNTTRHNGYSNMNSYSVPIVSYSGGSFKTSYNNIDILQNDILIYGGDKPGMILGKENSLLDNPIIGASTYASEPPVSVDCENCHEHLGDITINSYNTLFGLRYNVNVESNNGLLSAIIRFLTGSGLNETEKNIKVEEIRQELLKNHKCKTPIGDIDLIFVFGLILLYCIIINVKNKNLKLIN